MEARVRLLLGVLGVLGVLVAAWLLAVAPKRERAADLGAQVAQARLRLDDANARAAAAERARATYARDYATVARLGKAVPVSTDVPSLVYQLEAAARRSRVDFRAVSANDALPAAPSAATVASGGVQPAPFSFRFEGDYFGLQRLLARIGGFSRLRGAKLSVGGRLLTIDGLTVNAARQGLPRVQGMITARAYVADLPAALPSGTQAPASRVTP